MILGDELLHLANLLSSLGVNSGNINISLACILLRNLSKV